MLIEKNGKIIYWQIGLCVFVALIILTNMMVSRQVHNFEEDQGKNFSTALPQPPENPNRKDVSRYLDSRTSLDGSQLGTQKKNNSPSASNSTDFEQKIIHEIPLDTTILVQ